MARHNKRLGFSLFRAMPMHLVGPGILSCLVICFICCNSHLFFANASDSTEGATLEDSDKGQVTPFTHSSIAEEEKLTAVTPSAVRNVESSSSAEKENLSAVTPSTVHNVGSSSSAEGNEDELQDEADKAPGWLPWNPLSTAVKWAKYYLGWSEDQKTVLSTPQSTIRSEKGHKGINYYSRHCSSELCRGISLQMQVDMNSAADPCTNANEYYCGNWMRRTPVPQGRKSWSISMDTVQQKSTDFLISKLESLSCPIAATLPHAAVQDQWDSLLACSYQLCTDENTLNITGAKPLFAAMFDEDEESTSSLSFLIGSNFQEEAETARQADRLIQLGIESDEAEKILSSVDSLVAAASGSVASEAGEETAARTGPRNPKVKSLLRILVPRLRSIYRRMNAQFFWSFITMPHELDATKGYTLTIADLILGLPYRYYELKYAEQQRHYRRYLSDLLRLFDVQLSQYRRDIFDIGRASNLNMKLSYDERARLIFDFEANVLRKVVHSPHDHQDLEDTTHSVTFEQIKKSASALDVEAIIKMYLQDLGEALHPKNSLSPSSASHMAGLPRKMNGITVTESGEVVIDDNAEFIIYQKNYFSKIEKVLSDAKNWAVLHDYILVNLIRNQAKLLSGGFRTATEEFLLASARRAPVPPSQRCLSSLPKWLLGRLYVRGAFPEVNKAYVKKVVHNVKSAFHDMIQKSSWMDEQTRKHALNKLEAMKEKIGYPEWLIDPTESQVHFEEYYGNPTAALEAAKRGLHELTNHMRKQEIISALRKYGTSPDLWESGLLPHEAGADYLARTNELQLTAAFLQEPVMNRPSSNASPEELLVVEAVNYGGLAAFIGNLLASAIDREGSKYGTRGQPHYWWSWGSEVAFGKNLQCLRDQYSTYFVELDDAEGTLTTNHSVSPQAGATHSNPQPQAHTNVPFSAWGAKEKTDTNLRKVEKQNLNSQLLFLDGSSPVSMNYRDNVGLQAAWAAIQKQVTAAGLREKPLKALGEFLTVKQIFLYGWGHFWCEVSKPGFLREQILTSSSTPARFRSEGALANFDLFSKEYKCSANTPLNPAARCTVW